MPLTKWNCVLVINMTLGSNRAIKWPPIIATKYVSFATILNIRYQVLATHRKS